MFRVTAKSPNFPFDFYPRHIAINQKTGENQYILTNKYISNYVNNNKDFCGDVFCRLINHHVNANVFKDCVNQINGINFVDASLHINKPHKSLKNKDSAFLATYNLSPHANTKLQLSGEIIADAEDLLAYLNELIEKHNIENIINILKSNSYHKYAKFLLVAMIDVKINTSMSMSLLDREIINTLIILFANTINKSHKSKKSIFSAIKNINSTEINVNSRKNSSNFDKIDVQEISLQFNQVINNIENQVKSMAQQVKKNNIKNLNKQYDELTVNIINLIKLNSELEFSKLKKMQGSELLDKNNVAIKYPSINKTIEQIIIKCKQANNELGSDKQDITEKREKALIELITNKITNSHKEKNKNSIDKLSSDILSFFMEKELLKHYLSINKLLKNDANNNSAIISGSENILASLGKFIENIKSEFNNYKDFSVVYKPYKVNFDDKISVISNINNIIQKHAQSQPILLTLPDSPLLTRNGYINKKDKKRKPGENKCPCGSGKELRYCCKADSKDYHDDI